MKGKTVMRKL